MRVKRVIGRDAQEAMGKIKEDLGKEAVILHTRKIRQQGWKGWFVRPLIEVVAAVDELPAPPKAAPAGANGMDTGRIKALEEKYSQLDSLMKAYLQQGAAGRPGLPKYRPAVEAVLQTLMSNEVPERDAQKVAEVLDSMLAEGEDSGDVTETALHLLEQHLGKAAPITLKAGERKTVLFVGPTGIGKTTTLAKIAAMYTLQYGKKVGLMTADTYRIAAPEQLRVYADLLKIPLKVIYSPEDVAEALKEYADRDLILIDTAGKSIRDADHPKEINDLLLASGAQEVFLVLSATTGHASCMGILESYEFLDKYKLIFTKIDEATACGLIFSVRMTTDKPLAYLTNGQNVPDDIRVANPRSLAELLLSRRQTI